MGSTTRGGTAQRAAGLVEQAEFLDPLADGLARLLSPLRRLGPVTDLIAGKPLGHPAHPAVVLLPLGSWASATVLDLAGDESTAGAARMLTGAGVLFAGPAALTGIHDWLQTRGPERRVGLVHSLTNTAALTCFASGWVARRGGNRAAGMRLGLVGSGLMSLSAWLGGHLTYSRGVGVQAGEADPPSGLPTNAGGAHLKRPFRPAADATPDVVDLLVEQHEAVKALMARVDGASGEERARLFLELRRELAVHEAAEQGIVHPLTQQDVSGGEAIARARQDEEAEAVSALTELEQFDLDTDDFSSRFSRLREEVQTHAEHEETEELSRLRRQHGRDDLVALATGVRLAQQAARERLVRDNVASFPAMVDVAREAVRQAR